MTSPARCAWCDAPMDGPAPHDVVECRTRVEADALTDCPDCAGPHPAPCPYRAEADAWVRIGTPITPGQLRQVDDQRRDRA